jgi:hypothetical protein
MKFGGEGTSVPESEWPPHLAQAASELAKSCRASVGRARVYRGTGEVVFQFDCVGGADVNRCGVIAEKIAQRHGVASRCENGSVFLSSPQPRGAYGKLYAAEPYGKPQASGPADAGVINSRSGSSGYRGARDPFPSEITGPELQPSDYSSFGAEGDSAWHNWGRGRVNTPIGEYEGPGVAIITVGALALFGYALTRSR